MAPVRRSRQPVRSFPNGATVEPPTRYRTHVPPFSKSLVGPTVARAAHTLTGNRHSQRDGYGLGTLDESPGAGEVPGPDALVRVHLQRVIVPAAEHAVHPREHHVPMPVTADGGQRQYGHAAHEHGRLAQVLPGDPALHRVPDDDQPERHAAHGPRQAHVYL